MLCNNKLGGKQQNIIVADHTAEGILNHQDQAEP